MPDLTVNLLIVIAGGAVVLLAIAMLWGRMSRKTAPEQKRNPLAISLDDLGTSGPRQSGPTLQIYGTPVRLACVVLAPAGRATELPVDGQLPQLLDKVVPGIGQMFASDRPTVVRWPAQLSVQGFAQVFGQQAKLPGDAGKGTVWCGAAGRVESDNKKYLIGLIMRSAAPANVGQVVVERENQWPDILRVQGR